VTTVLDGLTAVALAGRLEFDAAYLAVSALLDVLLESEGAPS
jgi:hypothetical protein